MIKVKLLQKNIVGFPFKYGESNMCIYRHFLLKPNQLKIKEYGKSNETGREVTHVFGSWEVDGCGRDKAMCPGVPIFAFSPLER